MLFSPALFENGADFLNSINNSNTSMRSLVGLVVQSMAKVADIDITTSTTTTTQAPAIVELAKTISHIPSGLSNPTQKIIDTPVMVLNNVIKSTMHVGDTVGTQSSETDNQAKEDDSFYYEDLKSGSKYFSRECQFRFACEFGARTKVPQSLIKLTDFKLIRDLQNKYTKAMTYGFKYGQCEKYFCFVLEMLNGPAKFASGFAEFIEGLGPIRRRE